jgi:hypothetical protein
VVILAVRELVRDVGQMERKWTTTLLMTASLEETPVVSGLAFLVVSQCCYRPLHSCTHALV